MGKWSRGGKKKVEIWADFGDLEIYDRNGR